MICKSPILITRPNKAAGGLYQKVSVPCGTCGQCLATKRSEWTFRLKEEAKSHSLSHFITLTYDEENLPLSRRGHSTLIKEDLQKFMKRLRSYQDRIVKSPLKIRFYAVGEYGPETLRPHYHLITFSTEQDTIANILKIWTQGNVKIGEVTNASIHYCTKYFINYHEIKHRVSDCQPPFTLMSRKPGLGMGYIQRTMHYHQETKNNFVVTEGIKQRMPRIYKDKIFTPWQKQQFYNQAMQSQNQKVKDQLAQYDHYQNPSKYFAEQKQETSDLIFKNQNKSTL